jgi:hypothetical protein
MGFAKAFRGTDGTLSTLNADSPNTGGGRRTEDKET